MQPDACASKERKKNVRRDAKNVFVFVRVQTNKMHSVLEGRDYFTPFTYFFSSSFGGLLNVRKQCFWPFVRLLLFGKCLFQKWCVPKI